MKFYARKEELSALETQYKQTEFRSTMTVVTGRRRVGKTSLAREFAKDKIVLYLFVSKKSESLLCREYLETIRQMFASAVLGEINDFRTMFKLLLSLAKDQRIVVIIDEFQEFLSINPAVYSEMQDVWDQKKDHSHMHLLCLGSIQSLMERIFKDSHEPLFGRADKIINLKPFGCHAIREILLDHGHYSQENLFAHFMITGGVPRYEEVLIHNDAYTLKEILDLYLEKDSPFIDEGKNILIQEFGREFSQYFSILELLAAGRTSRGEIESILGTGIGGHLDRLSTTYNLVESWKPIGSKATGRLQKYHIDDNFLNFWFRFIHANRSAIEIGNFGYVRSIIDRDIGTFSGHVLERIFHQLLGVSGRFNKIGNYWENGNKNEIDVVGLNDVEKTMVIGEVKLNREKVDLHLLHVKSAKLIMAYPDYIKEYLPLGLQDIDRYL
jgi:uncharacterized protein